MHFLHPERFSLLEEFELTGQSGFVILRSECRPACR